MIFSVKGFSICESSNKRSSAGVKCNPKDTSNFSLCLKSIPFCSNKESKVFCKTSIISSSNKLTPALNSTSNTLFLDKKDNKYGVLDLQGKTKIFTENDEIGIDASKFEQNNIKNRYLLAENLIPIRKDKLWGLYDKNGRKIVDFNYDSFGYVASTNKDALNLLVIPDYNVIVACKGKKYTLLNSAGEELFAPIADDIYMTIDGGEKHYWIAVNDQRMDATEFLDKKGVSSNNSTSSNKANNTTNNNSKDSNETNNDNSTNNESQETSEQQDN